MLKRCVAVCFTLAMVLALAPQPVQAQTAGDGMPLRTPDGQPDVSGTFTYRTLTPLERPIQFEGRESLTPEEAAAYKYSPQEQALLDERMGSQVIGGPETVLRYLGNLIDDALRGGFTVLRP